MEERFDVDEFLLEVSAEVAALPRAEEPSSAHGDGGGGNSSETEEALLRPKPNMREPARELSGVPAGDFSLGSCFLENNPILDVSQD